MIAERTLKMDARHKACGMNLEKDCDYDTLGTVYLRKDRQGCSVMDRQSDGLEGMADAFRIALEQCLRSHGPFGPGMCEWFVEIPLSPNQVSDPLGRAGCVAWKFLNHMSDVCVPMSDKHTCTHESHHMIGRCGTQPVIKCDYCGKETIELGADPLPSRQFANINKEE